MAGGFKIEVPGDYFARVAAKEYADDAGMALIREFAQNSADAKATTVSFNFEGNNVLTVRDNGRGASADQIRTKVLTPLASEKEEGGVGGFGKAKELLFFGNPSWQIHSRGTVVKGRFLEVDSFEQGAESFAGFQVRVELPPGLYTAARTAARDFLRASERPGVTWVLNGQPVEVDVKRAKRCVKDFGFCKAYVERDCSDTKIYYRTGGLLTAVRWGYHPREVGRIVLELQGPSTELLTPARDNFRSAEHRRAVESWLNTLVTDYKRELADNVGDEILFEDDEFVTPGVRAAGVIDAAVIPNVGGIVADVSFKGPASPEALAQVAADIRAQVDAGFLPAEKADEALVRALVAAPAKPKGFDMALMPKVDGVKRVTVHTGSKEQAKLAAKWLKKNGDKAKRLLAAWTTAVRGVCALTKQEVDAVGFTFAKDAEAEFVRARNGRFALLINPLAFDFDGEWQMEEIVDSAIHEAAHQWRGPSHDEAWAMTYEALRRKSRSRALRGAVNRSLLTGAVVAVVEEV